MINTWTNLDDKKLDKRKKSHFKIIESIIDCNFWYDLVDMIEILKLFHDYQVMSKSGNIYLGYIIKRWKTIELYI